MEPGYTGYQAVMKAWAGAGNTAKASEWMQHMAASKLSPNQTTFSVLMESSAKRGDVLAISEIFLEMLARRVSPNTVNYNQLIDSCGRSRPKATAKAEHALSQMMVHRLEPTVQTIDALSRAVGCSRAVELSRNHGILLQQGCGSQSRHQYRGRASDAGWEAMQRMKVSRWQDWLQKD